MSIIVNSQDPSLLSHQPFDSLVCEQTIHRFKPRKNKHSKPKLYNKSVAQMLYRELGKIKYPEPGPGSYDPFIKPQQTFSQIKKKQPPLGGTMQRSSILDTSIQYPGPGAYELERTASTFQHNNFKKLRKALKSYENVSRKHQPLMPGPGSYQVVSQKQQRNYRFLFKQKPAVVRKQRRQSELQEMIEKIERSQQQLRQSQSPQLQKIKDSDRKLAKVRSNNLLKLFEIQESDEGRVGPGTYDFQPYTGPTYLQYKNTANFIQEKEKFRREPEELPGPGSYELVTVRRQKKQPMSVFLSKLKREFSDRRDYIAGPNTLSIKLPEKKSYIYNKSNKWL